MRNCLKPCLLWISLCFLYANSATAQEASAWEFEGAGGVNIAFRPVLRSLINGHVARFSLARSLGQSSSWGQYRNAARWGLALQSNNLGNPQELGRQWALKLQGDFACVAGVRSVIGLGLGANTRPYDFEENPQGVAIGTTFNLAISLGLSAPVFEGTNGSALLLKFQLDHQSNGAVAQPNLGSNVMTLGCVYRTGPTGPVKWWRAGVDPRFAARALRSTAPRSSELCARAGLGTRQRDALGARDFVLDYGLDWRWSPDPRWGLNIGAGGLLWQLNAIVPAGASDTAKTTSHYGIHAGPHLNFGALSVDFNYGRYIAGPAEYDSYYKLVWRIRLNEKLSANMELWSHGFRADHPSFGLTYHLGLNP
mgnify:CR=1 FL=1|jgi:hypothetical protein